MVLAGALFATITGCTLCHSVLCQTVKAEPFFLDIVQTLVVVSYDSTVGSRVGTLTIRGVPIWEFWFLPIPIIFLSKSTDTDHQSNIDLAYVKQ